MDNLKWYNSIFYKIVLGFIFCLSIPPILVLSFVLTNIRNDLIEDRGQESLHLLTQQYDEIEILLDDVIGNLNFLSQTPALNGYLDNPNEHTKAIVTELFVAFAHSEGTYDQVRLLSPEGMELVRINYQNQDAEIVSDVDLQDKSNRDYYQNAITLNPYEVYISDLSLNQEDGVIEEPYNPMIRYSMPLYDDDNNIQAILVLNLLPNEIFKIATVDSPVASYYAINDLGDIMYSNAEEVDSILYASDLDHDTRIHTLIPTLPLQPTQSDYFIDNSLGKLITYIPIIIDSPLAQWQWLLVREQSIDSLILPINQMIGSLVIMGIVGLLISLLVSIPITYTIITPLRTLISASKSLYKRDWQASITLVNAAKSRDEIGELAQSFEDTLYELRNFYGQLDIMVNERTAELSWANEQLKQVDNIKTTFMEDIAHDIRTPLASILLNTSFIKRNPSKALVYVERIERQAQRITSLMENVSMISKVELSFDSSKTLEPLLFHNIIVPIIQAHRSIIEEAGLALETNISAVPETLGIKFMLEQLFENLYTNAIKYTLTGVISIRLSHENQIITLEVEDTGMGISEDEIPFVRERYYRAKKVRQSTMPGTGIGLSIVQEAIRQHDGEFEISTKLEVGTKIKVSLPIKNETPNSKGE